MGEAPVIRWPISSIGHLPSPPQGWGRHFCFWVPTGELATHRPLGSFLSGFLLLPRPRSYPSKSLPFCSFEAFLSTALRSCQPPLQQLGPLEFRRKPPAQLANYRSPFNSTFIQQSFTEGQPALQPRARQWHSDKCKRPLPALKDGTLLEH